MVERLVLLAALALAVPAAARDRDLGTAVQKNITAQVVDLHPKHAGVPPEASNGVRSAAAVNRYLGGQVTPLQSISGGSQLGATGGQAGAGTGAAAGAGPGPR
ncbi:MAG: hypothetical protein KGQ52_00995 [Alphaproteobacteria bacterium]|nr:hypothetical protein [Alphaproteobacteria bacterium]